MHFRIVPIFLGTHALKCRDVEIAGFLAFDTDGAVKEGDGLRALHLDGLFLSAEMGGGVQHLLSGTDSAESSGHIKYPVGGAVDAVAAVGGKWALDWALGQLVLS